ncbi:SubName: Full=Uncharacterized protein {ECO:0000313/EMBL:CCA69573.1} [Serendipita indica DSM 11827]|nr:SubName: Full=Uncharacterized protein {ECO:0000313/EMBL:CCA69573.1} [Serendipita indica DSM 11827]
MDGIASSAPSSAAAVSNSATISSKEKNEANAAQPATGIAASLARALTRGVAVYFSRPVRLFRPTKVSGWTSLRGSALRDKTELSPQYILQLIRSQGFLIVPRHFIPPLAVNTVLGAVLWESYGLCSSYLEGKIPSHPIVMAASSGAFAGACQSLAAAPVENVRMVLESMSKVEADPVRTLLQKPAKVPTTHSGWMHAWRQVFIGDQPVAHATTREEVRELSRWVQEVKGMAGRGFDGWTWGCAKDMCGFALFFSIFEFSRATAVEVAYLSVAELERFRAMLPYAKPPSDKTRTSTARIAQGVTLVGGGVAAGLGYEIVCRPFDNARRFVWLDDRHHRGQNPSVTQTESRSRVVARVLFQHLKTHGILSFFANPHTATHTADAASTGASRGIYAVLRTLARVGPWGAGFLIYEALAGELPQV